jgi:hypothetical protein
VGTSEDLGWEAAMTEGISWGTWREKQGLGNTGAHMVGVVGRGNGSRLFGGRWALVGYLWSSSALASWLALSNIGVV